MARTATLLTTLALLLLLPAFPVQAGDGVLAGSENHRVIDCRRPGSL